MTAAQLGLMHMEEPLTVFRMTFRLCLLFSLGEWSAQSNTYMFVMICVHV